MPQQYHGIITIPNGNSCDTNNSNNKTCTNGNGSIYPIKSSLLSCMNNTQQFINNKLNKYNTTVSSTNSNNNGGELVVTIASALLLFCHFGITLYKIDRNHPETSIGKQHLKDRWLLINICILVFAIASHLYRQALSNLHIKFPLFVLLPDFVTTCVVLLNLTKHVYFALYLLMAGVTFLSITVSICDLYLYCFPVLAGADTTSTGTVSSFLYTTKKGNGNNTKYDWNDTDTCSTSSRSRLSSTDSYGNNTNNNVSMDSSIRSVNSTDSSRSTGSSMSQRNVRTSSISSNNNNNNNSNSNNNTTSSSTTGNSSTGRKKATRSILQRGRN